MTVASVSSSETPVSAATVSTVAVIQMVSGSDWQVNLQDARRLVLEAQKAGAKLVVLPENFAVFHSSILVERGAEEQTSAGPIRRFLAELSAELGIWIVAGSLPILSADGKRVRAVSMVYDDQGQERARYDKLHLFDVDVGDAHGAYRESDQIEPGDNLVVIDTPVGRLGLSICYDLRFPLLYQALRDKGAELITVPAAFTKVTGAAHWEVLLRARATETQCYVSAANQGGVHSKSRETFGHSMIVDPWGRVVAVKESDGEGVVCAQVDLQQVANIRQNMPVHEHRRDLRNL